jgi:receptor-type tyrosine-protein phosphatase gamma
MLKTFLNLLQIFYIMLFYFLIFTEPYTEYRIIVIAFTLKYDGEPSDQVIQRTDIPGPSAPQIINLTCHSQDALFLHWKRPSTFYNSIDSYVINYKEAHSQKLEELRVPTNSSIPDVWVCLIL